MAKNTYNIQIKKKEYKVSSFGELSKLLKKQKENVREEITKEIISDNLFYDWVISMDVSYKDLLFQWKKRINEVARRNKLNENFIQDLDINVIPREESEEESEFGESDSEEEMLSHFGKSLKNLV